MVILTYGPRFIWISLVNSLAQHTLYCVTTPSDCAILLLVYGPYSSNLGCVIFSSMIFDVAWNTSEINRTSRIKKCSLLQQDFFGMRDFCMVGNVQGENVPLPYGTWNLMKNCNFVSQERGPTQTKCLHRQPFTTKININ